MHLKIIRFDEHKLQKKYVDRESTGVSFDEQLTIFYMFWRKNVSTDQLKNLNLKG